MRDITCHIPRRAAERGLGDSCSIDPSAAPITDPFDIEKSDLHSRGGRLSVSLTGPMCPPGLCQDRARERSLVPEDGLESPENGVRAREDGWREKVRDGASAPKLSGTSPFCSHPGAGWTCTQSSLPCATATLVTPVGIGTCVTAGDAFGQPGIGC